jgi:hypothetical protein
MGRDYVSVGLGLWRALCPSYRDMTRRKPFPVPLCPLKSHTNWPEHEFGSPRRFIHIQKFFQRYGYYLVFWNPVCTLDDAVLFLLFVWSSDSGSLALMGLVAVSRSSLLECRHSTSIRKSICTATTSLYDNRESVSTHKEKSVTSRALCVPPDPCFLFLNRKVCCEIHTYFLRGL